MPATMASTASLPAYALPGVPVHQPPHLEGNPSLATEILPGPPPLVSAQQSAQKRDPKKPTISFSYLPPSDPGSTYSGLMHGTLIGQDLLTEGSRVKRSRSEKALTTGRAQRASARQQSGVQSVMDTSIQGEVTAQHKSSPGEADGVDFMAVDEIIPLSRSNSTHNLLEISNTTKGRRKDKGKGKEVEGLTVRVKEEPKAVSLLTPEPSTSMLNNDDHCSSCRSQGALVYCDGCPRAFHLWCLDPPVEHIDEGDSRWYCPGCVIKKHPPRRPSPSFPSSLIHQIETSIPTEFQLPEDVRSFFKDVGTGPRGTYIDTSEVKQHRLNRLGQLEERDAYRLRDRNGTPVLCYRCGTSALPSGAAAAPASKRPRRSVARTSTPESWRSIISCDYCNLHWHLDCLDPPLSAMPPFNKKWMCPNHAEQILPSKRRIPKHNVPPLDITQPRQFNNGNIEIIHSEPAPAPPVTKKMVVDEVLINGRRYRVPERIIVFDFWNKVNRSDGLTRREMETPSGLSSPLTSLSSLEDTEERNVAAGRLSSHDNDILRVAQLLCNLRNMRTGDQPSAIPRHNKRKSREATTISEIVEAPIQDNQPPQSKRPPSRLAHQIVTTNSTSRAEGAEKAGLVPNSHVKHKRTTHQPPPEPSTRELRSRSKNVESSLTSVSSRGSLRRADESSQDSVTNEATTSIHPPSFQKPKTIIIKVEEVDTPTSLAGDPHLNEGIEIAHPKVIVRRGRPPRRSSMKEVEPPKKLERRGRKRKEREDDTQEKAEAETRGIYEGKEKKTKPSNNLAHPPTPTILHPHIPTTTSTPPTPTLKIRLPPRSQATGGSPVKSIIS